MVCACAPTSTVWLAAPTLSVRFVVAFSLTSTLNGLLDDLAKPFASAVTEYKPGATDRKRYRPLASDVVTKLNPFSSSESITLAPCTTAPLESVSSPLTVPKYAWPRASDGTRSISVMRTGRVWNERRGIETDACIGTLLDAVRGRT